MPNVLVTGASGMIGMYLCSNLLHKGYTVFATDSKPNEFVGTNENYRFTKCDITDKDTVGGIFSSDKIDAVVHLANTVDNDFDSYVSDTELKRSKITDKYLYAAAHKAGVGCFILLSTTYVYGLQKGREPIREENPEKGNTNYADLKMTSEKLINKEFKKSSAKIVIARCAPIYTAEYTQNLRDRIYDSTENTAYLMEGAFSEYSFCCVFNLIDFISGILAEGGGKHSDLYNIADTKMLTAQQIVEFEKSHHRINNVALKDTSFTHGLNKAKMKADYRYFDPSMSFYNWFIDNTKARRYAPFRWTLSNTK